MRGYVSLNCSLEQGRAFTARLLGVEPETVTDREEVKDAVGEIVNMIAGNAKDVLSEKGHVEIALPTVCLSVDPNISVKGSTGVVVPFEDPTGVFCIELIVNEAEES